MTDLADRIERAEAGSRELDMELARVLNPNVTRLTVPPHYTTSIDAALTLVPEGYVWAFLDSRALIRKPKSMVHSLGEAATPALAICAAAIRARAIEAEGAPG